MKLCTFIIADLENNQIDVINHIEAKITEFATTTRHAKDNVRHPNIVVYALLTIAAGIT